MFQVPSRVCFCVCAAQIEESHWRLALFRRMRGCVNVNSNWSIDAISLVAKSFKKFRKLNVSLPKISEMVENKIEFKSPHFRSIEPIMWRVVQNSDQEYDLAEFLRTHPQINNISIQSIFPPKLVQKCKRVPNWSVVSGVGIPRCFSGKLEASEISHIRSLTLESSATCPISLLHPKLAKLDLSAHLSHSPILQTIPRFSSLHLPNLRDLRLQFSTQVLSQLNGPFLISRFS